MPGLDFSGSKIPCQWYREFFRSKVLSHFDEFLWIPWAGFVTRFGIFWSTLPISLCPFHGTAVLLAEPHRNGVCFFSPSHCPSTSHPVTYLQNSSMPVSPPFLLSSFFCWVSASWLNSCFDLQTAFLFLKRESINCKFIVPKAIVSVRPAPGADPACSPESRPFRDAVLSQY